MNQQSWLLLISSLSLGIVIGISTQGLAASNDAIFELAANVATVITCLSIIVAVGSLSYQRSHDRKLSVADQVRLFRTEVIPAFEILLKKIQAADETYKFPRFSKIETFSFAWLIKNYLLPSKAQNELKIKMDKKYGYAESNSYFFDAFNAMEELAIRVNINGTADDDGLRSIKRRYHIVQMDISLQKAFTRSGLLLHIALRQRKLNGV